MERAQDLFPDMLQRLEELRSISPLQSIEVPNRKNRHKRGLGSFWPLLAGLLFAAFAPSLQRAISQTVGDTGLQLLFPFVTLSERLGNSLHSDLAQFLPTLALYGTFPLLGWYAAWNFRHRMSVLATGMQIACVYSQAAALVWLVNQPGLH